MKFLWRKKNMCTLIFLNAEMDWRNLRYKRKKYLQKEKWEGNIRYKLNYEEIPKKDKCGWEGNICPAIKQRRRGEGGFAFLVNTSRKMGIDFEKSEFLKKRNIYSEEERDFFVKPCLYKSLRCLSENWHFLYLSFYLFKPVPFWSISCPMFLKYRTHVAWYLDLVHYHWNLLNYDAH